jgi:hypothetical protein
MGNLQRARPTGQEWFAPKPIAASVHGTECIVEGKAPVSQVGEVGKRIFRFLRFTPGAMDSEYGKNRGKGVQREKCPHSKEEARWQDPGRLIAVCWVEDGLSCRPESFQESHADAGARERSAAPSSDVDGNGPLGPDKSEESKEIGLPIMMLMILCVCCRDGSQIVSNEILRLEELKRTALESWRLKPHVGNLRHTR